MITVSLPVWALLCFLAGSGLVCCVLSCWDWLQRWLCNRVEARLKPEGRTGKFLRHAPTGRVGLCVGGGIAKRWPRLGWLFTVEKIEMVFCPCCAQTILQPMPLSLMGKMRAKASGHVELMTARDVVAALMTEVEAFKAQMGQFNRASEP